VVGNDVEDDVDPLFVGGLNEVAEFLPRAEVRIYVEEILNSVTMLAWFECDLPEDWTDPQGGYAQPAKVA
jgi:hypothetical protein